MTHAFASQSARPPAPPFVGGFAAFAQSRGRTLALGCTMVLAACGAPDAPPPAVAVDAGERVTASACTINNLQGCTLPPPTIGGLTDATVGVGQGVVFSALTTGQGPLTYQWSRRAPGSQRFLALQGATAPNYKVPATTLANNGDVYQLRVVDRFGAASTAQATLNVVQGAWAPLSGRGLSGARQPSLALCDQPSIAVVSAEGARDVMQVYRFDGLLWRPYGTLTPATPTGHMADPSLDCVFDGQNARPIVAWSEGNGGGRTVHVRYWDGVAWRDTQPGPLNRVAGSQAIKPVLRVTPYDPNVNHVPANGVTRRSAVAWIENGVPSVRRWDGAQWAAPLGGVAVADPSATAATDLALKIDLEYQQQYPAVVAWLRNEAGQHSVYAAIHTTTTLPGGTQVGGWTSIGNRASLGASFSAPRAGIHLASGKLGAQSLAVPVIVRAELPAPNRVRSFYLDSASYLNLVSGQPWLDYARSHTAPSTLTALSLDGNELPRLNCAGETVPAFGLAISDDTGFEVRTSDCNGTPPAVWRARLPRHPASLLRASLRMAGADDPLVAGEQKVAGVYQVVVWRYVP
jgi:hypothetical protein